MHRNHYSHYCLLSAETCTVILGKGLKNQAERDRKRQRGGEKRSCGWIQHMYQQSPWIVASLRQRDFSCSGSERTQKEWAKRGGPATSLVRQMLTPPGRVAKTSLLTYRGRTMGIGVGNTPTQLSRWPDHNVPLCLRLPASQRPFQACRFSLLG